MNPNPQTKHIIRSITYTVPSATREGITHTVTEDVESGRRSCTCEASDHPKTAGKCWHLRAITAGMVKPRVRVTQRAAPAPRPTVRRARTSPEGLAFAASLDV